MLLGHAFRCESVGIEFLLLLLHCRLKLLLLLNQLTFELLLLFLELHGVQLLAVCNGLVIGSLRLQLLHWILNVVLQVLHQ